MRKGRRLDGWLVLDKPPGLSSGAAVARAKRLLGAAKVDAISAILLVAIAVFTALFWISGQ